MALDLTSSAFEQGGTIPKKYTADGDNVSPPLRWRGTPDGTRSFVLLCNDPDAPGGTFRHWAAYDIPADRVELAEGHGAGFGLRPGATTPVGGHGDFGSIGSGGRPRRP